MARRVRSSVAACSTVPKLKRKATSAASDHWPMAAAPIIARVMRTFMSTWRARRLKTAARATNTPPLTTAAPKSHGAAAGATALGHEPGQRERAGDERGHGAGLREPEPAPGARRGRRRAAVARPSPRRAARRCRSPGGGRRGTRRASAASSRVEGDGQRRGAEVDVGAAHAALPPQRALQLDRAVGAVHAGDVQDAPLVAALGRQRAREVERPVRRAPPAGSGPRSGPARRRGGRRSPRRRPPAPARRSSRAGGRERRPARPRGCRRAAAARGPPRPRSRRTRPRAAAPATSSSVRSVMSARSAQACAERSSGRAPRAPG